MAAARCDRQPRQCRRMNMLGAGCLQDFAEEAEENEHAAAATTHVSTYPRGSFRPGRVVWAKVEGHDWWPARIVRRRAVPREVGPPPGGPDHVRTHIPVVFFTSRGIPGEVTEGMDTVEGAMAAAVHAMGANGQLLPGS